MTGPGNDDTEDFASMLAEFEREHDAPAAGRRGPKVGDLVRGTVVSIGSEAVFLDLGAKSEGQLDREQVVDPDGNLLVEVGDQLEARVVEAGGRSGTIILRRTIGKGAEAKAELLQAAELGLPVEGLVTAVNKGGVEVQVAGVRGFCPMSQLDNRYVEDPEGFVGRKLTFRITKYETGSRGNLVLSRRELLEAEAAVAAEQTRAQLEPGAIMRGTVTTIKPYGAFVDLGGIEGLLHVSELGYARVGDPTDVLSVGQQVEVAVISVEKTSDSKNPEKVSLSLKHLETDPWLDLAQRYPEGTRVRGTVVRTQPFGAFVELEPGIEGLVHISELGAGRRINHPREVVQNAQEVEVTVLGVDLERRRVSLSMSDERAEPDVDVKQYASTRGQSLGTLGELLKDKLGK
jgi:small subunit ribosomal protein S1